jgi:hypothetical protein
MISARQLSRTVTLIHHCHRSQELLQVAPFRLAVGKNTQHQIPNAPAFRIPLHLRQSETPDFFAP